MSRRIVLIGATGLVGRAVVAKAQGRQALHLTALSRRQVTAPAGSETIIADPSAWPQIIADTVPDVLACTLGTTWRRAGQSEAGFRAVDEDLVLTCAQAAAEAGARQMIVISSVGADAASRSLYLRVKGEVEQSLRRMDFARLDILRPGLLRGARGEDRRVRERLAIIAAPLTDRLLHGPLRPMRSIPATQVAQAVLALATTAGEGCFVHDNDAMRDTIARERR